MSSIEFSEAALRGAVQAYISRLRLGGRAFLILLSEFVEKKNWQTFHGTVLPKKKTFSISEMKNAYKERTKELILNNKTSSRHEDDFWAKTSGFPTTVVRKFRNEIAPVSWRMKGRRPVKN